MRPSPDQTRPESNGPRASLRLRPDVSLPPAAAISQRSRRDGSIGSSEMQKELAIPRVAGDRRFGHGCAHQSYLSSPDGRVRHDTVLNVRIANDSFFSHVGAPGFELRLHESDDIGARTQ